MTVKNRGVCVCLRQAHLGSQSLLYRLDINLSQVTASFVVGHCHLVVQTGNTSNKGNIQYKGKLRPIKSDILSVLQFCR